jgi:Alkylmercury lyase
MAQNVPTYEFSDDALRVRQFVFEFWSDQRRPPNLRDVGEALDLTRRQIIDAYKALDLGIIITADLDTQNCNLLKAPPFSAYPSQVAVFVDGEFHSYAGCASEAVAMSHMPPFEDRELRLEGYCACCLHPITLVSKNFEIQSEDPEGVLMHISSSPHDWNNVSMVTMCDSMNFVLDAGHADRYERQVSRRGVLLNLDQVKQFVQYTASQRMRNYHWPPQTMMPEVVIQLFEGYGVDVTNWRG